MTLGALGTPESGKQYLVGIACRSVRALAKSDRRMNKSYVATQDARVRLWDAATEGCFQQKVWSPDADRVKDATRAVAEIVQSFK